MIAGTPFQFLHIHVLREYLSVHDAAVGGSGDTARLATRVLAELTPSIVTMLQGLLAFHEPQASAPPPLKPAPPPSPHPPPPSRRLSSLTDLPAPRVQFVRHLPGFYPLFVDLMHCDSKELRHILREIFSQRIGTVLHERQQAL